MADAPNNSKFSFLKKSLPWLGTIASIALPQAAPFISVATKILGTKTGKTIAPTAEGLASALSDALGDPAQHAQLMEAEQAFQQAMQQMNFTHIEDLEQLDDADRASARNREIQVKDKIPAILAVLITLGFFSVLGYMLLRTIPVSGHDAMLLMLGSLSSAWVSVVAYYFGSSAGSARKSELLALAPPVQKTA